MSTRDFDPTAPDDLTAQQDAVATAKEALHKALLDLSSAALTEARVARRSTGLPDLDAVRAAITRLDLAEQAHDTARLDLSTAAGQDA